VKPITKPNYWELRKGDVLLGTLVAYDLDFPWFYCHFTPTEAFAPHRAGFDEDLRWLEVGEADEAYYDHYEKITADMKLIRTNSDSHHVKQFLLHIDGDKAWFRAIHEE
jgi:hypothetical protein